MEIFNVLLHSLNENTPPGAKVIIKRILDFYCLNIYSQ